MTTTAASLGVLRGAYHSVVQTMLVLVAGGSAGLLVYLECRDARLRLLPVGVAVGVLMLASVVTPPRTSKDLWSYTMYGRIVSVHGASPYDTVPAGYPSDPLLPRVSVRWRERGSVYGPLFVAVAAGGTLVAGDSALVSRLFFQVLAALALLAILVVVWRTTRSVAAVAFLGLNPLLVVTVVNGGHNDVWIGLALVIAVRLAMRQRGWAVGTMVGLAALVKLTAGLALIGLLLWAWRHHLRRFAISAVTATGALLMVGYLPVLAGASHVLAGGNKTVTNGSPWNPLVDRLLRHDAWRNVPDPLAPNATLTAVFYASSALVLALAVVFAWLAAREQSPDPPTALAMASYPVAAQYAFPWYCAWALPLFATRRITPIAWVVWLQSIVLLAALKLPGPVTGDASHAVLRIALTYLAPPCLLVAFVVTGVRSYGGLRSQTGRPLRAAGSSRGEVATSHAHD